jgi:hypothetical protein
VPITSKSQPEDFIFATCDEKLVAPLLRDVGPAKSTPIDFKPAGHAFGKRHFQTESPNASSQKVLDTGDKNNLLFNNYKADANAPTVNGNMTLNLDSATATSFALSTSTTD